MVIKTSNNRNTQTWYFDQRSLTIKTRLNNQSWDIKSSGRTSNMQIWSTNSGWWQIFTFKGEHFCNIQQSNRCLEVKGSKDDEGASVGVANRNNNANQRWRVVYKDKSTTQTKGLDKDFGW
jgi:hypothetical protein